MRRNHFELGVCTFARRLVGAPSSKMRHVPEACALHVLIGDFDHQLGPQRLPRKVLTLAPTALATRSTLRSFAVCGKMLRPMLPGMIRQRVLTIRREELDQFPALLVREAGAHADMLQCA